MLIRKYQKSDCAELAKLFYNTVHVVNAKDYTKEQLDAWATGQIDLAEWNRSLQEHYSLVAVADKVITGFGDIDRAGCIDRLFVHADYQRMGNATANCDRLEAAINVNIVTYASITARPFFESRGYKVLKMQRVKRKEQFLTNFFMIKR